MNNLRKEVTSMTENKTVLSRPALKIGSLRGSRFFTNLVTQKFRDNNSKLEIFEIVFAPESTLTQQLEACEDVLHHIASAVNVTTFKVATKRYPSAVEKLLSGKPVTYAYHAYRVTYYNKQVENVVFITARLATTEEWEALNNDNNVEAVASPVRTFKRPSLEEMVYAAQHSGINMNTNVDNEVQDDDQTERSVNHDENTADVSAASGNAEA
jgi:hypothetical protein